MVEQVAEKETVRRISGFDTDVVPLLGVGIALTGLVLGLRPRFAPLPLALTALAAMFYRDPDRSTPGNPQFLYAIADGHVLQLSEFYEHRFLHTDALCLSTLLSPFDVPVNRSPSTGIVRYLEHIPGEQRLLSDAQATERNAHTYLGIETDWGPLLIRNLVGPFSQRIVLRVECGDAVNAGTRLSTVRFGSRTDLIIQRDSLELLVQPGQRLIGGITPIGRVVPL